MLSRLRKILLPTALVLFILELLTLPIVLGLTYATRSESPEHILTFSDKKLQWDTNTEVNADGTAKLSLFEAVYSNVQADDHARILAPGTEGDSIVRLKNDAEEPISFTALVYSVRSSDKLPVTVSLSGEGFSDTGEYVLPEGVTNDSVIDAVKGTVSSGQIQDFDIDWRWLYEESDAQDVSDTELGDRAALGNADDVTVGVHIVVTDKDGEVIVSTPKTGDEFVIGWWILALCISGILSVVLLVIPRMKVK